MGRLRCAFHARPVVRTSTEVVFMADRRVETALRDIDALFRLGVVSEMSDGQLLERFAAQTGSDSEFAFEAIVRRHGPMVLGVCRRVLGDDHAAEDAFQATFMVLALRPRAIRKPESSGPWLHGVATRIARRALVLRRRRKEEPIASWDRVARSADGQALVDLQTVIDDELSRLPDKYRRPVVLCYLEGQTQDEAARTLGWTKGTVSGRLARAKDLLRHRLTRRGLAPSVGLFAAALTPETASAAVPSGALVADGPGRNGRRPRRRRSRSCHRSGCVAGPRGYEGHGTEPPGPGRSPGLFLGARCRGPRDPHATTSYAPAAQQPRAAGGRWGAPLLTSDRHGWIAASTLCRLRSSTCASAPP